MKKTEIALAAAGGHFERRVQPRAWKVYAKGFGDQPVSVTMATTRGRAIARNLASAQDAGYGLKWGDFKAVRSQDHDGMFERHGLFSWSWDHVQALLCDDKRLNTTAEQPARAEDTR